MTLPEMFKGKRNEGLTLIEILIVMAIGFILVLVVLPIYPNINISAHLNDYSERMVQDLRIVHDRSKGRLNDQSHGLYILPVDEGNGYVLYEGESYMLRNSEYDRFVEISEVVSATSTYGYDINFAKTTGFPNQIGTITLSHVIEGERQLFVSSSGVISEI